MLSTTTTTNDVNIELQIISQKMYTQNSSRKSLPKPTLRHTLVIPPSVRIVGVALFKNLCRRYKEFTRKQKNTSIERYITVKCITVSKSLPVQTLY